MTDLATLGIRYDGTGAAEAKQSYSQIAVAAEGVEASVRGAETSMDRLAAAARGQGASLMVANTAMTQQRRQLDAVRGATGLTAQEGLNLSRQFADIGVQAAMMQNPLMILAAQGPQIADIFQTASMRGVGFRAALGGILAGVSPLVIGLGALTAVGAGLAAGWLTGERSALGYERAVTGVGRSAGLTAAELRTLTIESADLGEVSIRAAQQQASAYLQTGMIGSQVLGDLIAIGKDYAAFMGVEAPKATEMLAEAMKDPESAAREMTRTFGLLTQEQIKQVDAAMKAGDQARAQGIIIGELKPIIAGHAEDVASMTNAWDALGRSISNAITRFGEWLYETEGEKLQKLIDQRAAVERDVRERGISLQPQSQALYDRWGQEAQDIINRRNARSNRQDPVQAAANQQAQLRADQADTPRRPQVSEAERDYQRLIEQSEQFVVQMQQERAEMGLSEVEMVRLNAARRARQLIGTGTEEGVALAGQIVSEAERLIAVMTDFNLPALGRVTLEDLNVKLPEITTNAEILADELREIDRLAQDAGFGMASAFGSAGQAMSDLLTNLSGYQSRMKEIELDREKGRLTAEQAERASANAQVQNYGDMAAAAKGFFAEGSEGYRVLQTAEQAFRLFQFAMSAQAMLMDTQETGSSIANSLARGAAAAAEGAANMFAELGPLGFPAVAAMLAVLAAVGLSAAGGGGGGGSQKGASAANDNSPAATTAAVRAMTARDAQVRADQAGQSTTTVRVVPADDRFNAYVDNRAQPMAAQAYRSSVTASRGIIPAEQNRRDRFKLGGKSAYGR